MYNGVKVRTYSRKNSSYLKKAFVASNFNEMCRLCLSELSKGLTPIINNSDKMSYQEWIEYSVDIKVEEGDGLPPNICTECLQLLEQTYLFKKKCRTSDNKLREHLELIEQNHNRLRHSLVGFSDFEDELNLFLRNDSTQNTGEQNNLSYSGGTDLDTHTLENPLCIDIIGSLQDEDDDAEGDDDDSIYRNINYTPSHTQVLDMSGVFWKISIETKDLEHQTESIPKVYENRKKGEVKIKGYQGEDKSKRYQDEIEHKEDESEMKGKVSEGLDSTNQKLLSNGENQTDDKEHKDETKDKEHEGEMKNKKFEGLDSTNQKLLSNGENRTDNKEHEDKIEHKEHKGEMKDKEFEGHNSTVQNLLSNEENRTDDNDDEPELVIDLTRDEKNDDTLIVPEHSDEDNARENYGSFQACQAEKSDTTARAIYEQWPCAEVQQVAKMPSTGGCFTSYYGYNSNNKTVIDDRRHFGCSHADETREPPKQNLTAGRDKVTQASKRGIAVRKTRKYLCESDPFHINRIYRTRDHIKVIETVPDEARYNCCMCSHTYPTLPDLKEHLVSAHHISESSSCEICFKTFTCVSSLRRHKLIHAGFRPHKCRICGRGFSQISVLKRHVLTHETFRPYICEKCHKGYTQKRSLVAHIKTHSMLRSSCTFSCQSCGKSFVYQSGLSRHLRKHKGYRFMCDGCMKSYGDVSSLRRHVKKFHPYTIPEPIVMNVRPSTAP